MKTTTETGMQPAGEKVPADPFLNRERAVFAAGCFWSAEPEFRKLAGVSTTTVGYTGGTHENPTYDDVCSGLTGHAMAVEVVYDPTQVTYEQLLDVFWDLHDPTQLNRQGTDVGSHYRSAIFFDNADQERLAQRSKARMQASGRYEAPIVTEVVPTAKFYKAEDCHQQYLEKAGQVPCHG